MNKETLYAAGSLISRIDTLQEINARATGKWESKGPKETFYDTLKRIEFLFLQCKVPTTEIDMFKENVLAWSASKASAEIKKLTEEFESL